MWSRKDLGRKRKVCIGRALFFPSQSIVLFLDGVCTVLPTNTHIRLACHFLNRNETVNHLNKCLCHSKVFSQVSSSLLLGLNWNCLTGKITRTGPSYIFVLNWNLGVRFWRWQSAVPLFSLQLGEGQWLVTCLAYTTPHGRLGFRAVWGCEKTLNAYHLGINT